MKSSAIVAILCAAACLFGAPASAAGDANALGRELAARAIDADAAAEGRVKLYPGVVAPLPTAVTLPPGARVVGTVVVRDDPKAYWRTTYYRVYFDDARSPNALLDAMDELMRARGLRPYGSSLDETGGGFMVSAAARATYCASDARLPLTFVARRHGSGSWATVSEQIVVAGRRQLPFRVCPVRAGIDATPEPRRAAERSRVPMPAIREVPTARVDLQRTFASSGAEMQLGYVATRLSPGAVLDGWTAGFAAEGWTLRRRSVQDDAAVATFSHGSGDSAPTVLASITQVAGGRYVAMLQRLEPPGTIPPTSVSKTVP